MAAVSKINYKFDKQLKEARKLHLDGKLEEAEKSYAKLLRKQNGHSILLSLMGVCLLQKNEIQSALGYLKRAHAKDGDNPDIAYNLGLAHYHSKQYEQAIAAFNLAVRYAPNHDSAHYMCGRAYLKWGPSHNLDALPYFQKDIELNDRVDSLSMAAEILHGSNRTEEARHYAKRVLEKDSTNEIGLFIMARSLLVADFKKVEVDAAFVEPAMKLANILLKLHPDSWRGHLVLAEALIMVGEDALALPHLEIVVETGPDIATHKANVSVILLRQGRLEEGWREIGSRKDDSKFYGMDCEVLERCPAPLWGGELERGKSIFVAAEQGIGDQILHCQLVHDLLEAGMTVSMTCTPKIQKLLERSLPDVEFFSKKDHAPQAVLDAVDYKAELLQLCSFLRKEKSDFTRPFYFLKAEPDLIDHFQAKYKQFGEKLKVGISWRSVSRSAGTLKSTQLEQWGPILTIPGVQFINIQYLIDKSEMEQVKNLYGVDIFVDDFDPFEDVEKAAAQIAALDLVISVSNASVHLAGQLQIPTWVILSNRPLWHWFDRGDKSLWYDSLKLYRQPQLQGWQPVIENIANDLEQVVCQGNQSIT